jgi:hypothetical protein
MTNLSLRSLVDFRASMGRLSDRSDLNREIDANRRMLGDEADEHCSVELEFSDSSFSPPQRISARTMAPKYDPSKPNFLRHFSLWLSFIHACCALVLVPIAIFGQAYQVGSTEVWDAAHAKEFSSLSWPQQLWRWCEALQQHEPTALHQFISGFAGVYYIVDLIIVWLDVHPIEFTLKCWYSVHHVLCWIGLVFPVFYYRSTWDIDLAYVGFWVGEISNPPRCIVDLLEYQIDTQKSASKDKPLPSRFVTILGKRYSVGQLQKTMATLAKIHLWSFVAFR